MLMFHVFRFHSVCYHLFSCYLSLLCDAFFIVQLSDWMLVSVGTTKTAAMANYSANSFFLNL